MSGGVPHVCRLLDHPVRDEMQRQMLLHHLFYILGIPPPPAHKPFYFPGSIPVSLRRKQLQHIHASNYTVTEKTDGVRYLLLLCRLDERSRAYLINRRCDLYEIPVTADASFFDGTVLDGELVDVLDPSPEPVDEWGNQVFWIFDLLALQGRAFVNRMHAERYKMLSALFEVNPPYMPQVEHRELFNQELAKRQNLARKRHCIIPLYPRLTFRMKAFLNVRDLDSILPVLHARPYPVDGLIFMPGSQKVVLGTDWDQYKWKMFQTIDLLVQIHGTAPIAYVSLTYRTRYYDQEFALDILRHGILLNEEAYTYNRDRPLQPIWQHFRLVDEQNLVGSLLQYVQGQGSAGAECAGWQPLAHADQAAPAFSEPQLSLKASPAERCFLVETLVRYPPEVVLPNGGGTPSPTQLPLELVPCKVRTDKEDPNNDWTVQQTVFHVLENITIDDLRARLITNPLRLQGPVGRIPAQRSPPPPAEEGPRKKMRYDPGATGKTTTPRDQEEDEYDPLNPRM